MNEDFITIDLNYKKVEWSNRLYYILSYTIFSCLFIMFIYFLNQRIDYLLNSDMSSEMILSEIIAGSGKLLNHDWYYSTEIRFFYIQLFTVPFFYFTSNWHLIRVIATIIIVCIFMASLFFLMYSLNQHRFFPIIASLLILPVSFKYYEYVIYGLYYTPNIILELNIIAIMFIISKTQNKNKKIILIVVTLLLSLIAGLSGLRNLINIFVPLGIASLITFLINLKSEHFKKCKDFFILTTLVCAVGCVGNVINYFFLTKSFELSRFGYTSEFDFTLNKDGLRNVLQGFFNVLGFNINNIYLEIVLTLVLIAIFAVAFIKYFNLSLDEKLLAITLLSALVIYVIIQTFTNIIFMPAYLIPIAMLFFFIVVAILKNLKKTKISKHIIICLSCALCLCSVISSSINYVKLFKIDNTLMQRDVLSIVLEEDCYEGYATFWNGNILTELSDGKVRVRHFEPHAYYETNIDNNYKWLQQKSFIERKPEGKVFVLFTTDEYENFSLADYFIDDTYLVESNESYKLYIYSSYDEMIKVTGVEHNF